jgi:hypothetical protein
LASRPADEWLEIRTDGWWFVMTTAVRCADVQPFVPAQRDIRTQSGVQARARRSAAMMAATTVGQSWMIIA